MLSIYQSAPSKRFKSGGARGGGGASGEGGGGGSGAAGAWTLAGEEPQQGKYKSCGGHTSAKTRKGFTSTVSTALAILVAPKTRLVASLITSTGDTGGPEITPGSARCDCDTGDSPSIGVAK